MNTGNEQFDDSIDYEKAARSYDDVRTGNVEMMEILVDILSPHSGSLVLDVGCGTGNNTRLFAQLTRTQIVGLDLSHEMLRKAASKLSDSTLIRGEASALPFRNETFEYAFMTEVIHHLPKKNLAVTNLQDIMKSRGRICIVTQSHKQIEERMTSRFFPSTMTVDQKRYPRIYALKQLLSEVGFKGVRSRERKLSPIEQSSDFLECVEKKGYSMLRKISASEYESGLRKIRQTLNRQKSLIYVPAYTFIYATKP